MRRVLHDGRSAISKSPEPFVSFIRKISEAYRLEGACRVGRGVEVDYRPFTRADSPWKFFRYSTSARGGDGERKIVVASCSISMRRGSSICSWRSISEVPGV